MRLLRIYIIYYIKYVYDTKLDVVRRGFYNTYSNMNSDMIRLQLVEKTVRKPANAWFSIFVLIS